MVAPSGLTASAKVLTGERSQDPNRSKRAWQDEVWQFYDESGPLRYGVNWLANLISRARLMAAEVGEPGDEPTPVDNGEAADAVEVLAGGVSGQPKLLRSSVIGLTVPGLCYLVGKTETSSQTWEICSADELRMKSPAAPGRDAIYEQKMGPDSGDWEVLPDESTICKIWRPHERFHWEADSPARAALPSLRELKRITDYIDATLLSRLTGSGILLLPKDGISYPAGNTPDGKTPTFITEVVDVMMDAVKHPGTASARVPIPLAIDSEFLDKVKHLDFSTELSEKILEMRESALRQAAITIDVPAEVLTGMGEINHWGQWQIEESAVKIHAEPLLELITHALTIGFLHPVLRASGMGEEEVMNFVVWADTSEMTARPDKSDDAIKLHEKGVIGDEALLRETGLSVDDMASEEDTEKWAFRQLIAQPANAKAGLEGLGIATPEAMEPAPVPPALAQGAEEGAEQPPGEEDESGAEQRTAPEPPENESEPFNLATVIALEGFVYRALERAGNRAKNKLRGQEIHLNGSSSDDPEVFLRLVADHVARLDIQGDLLNGAWRRLDVTATDLGLDPVATCVCLSKYTETLIREGWGHTRGSLCNALRGMAVAA
jgi:hypothetical protein